MKKIYSIAMIAAVAIGCNRGANPAKDYTDVKSVPKHGNSLGTQEFLVSPFVIEIVGKTSVVAGEKGEVFFKVKPDPRVQEFRLEASQLPNGATLSSTKDPSVFVMTWTPDRNILIDLKQNYVEVVLRAFVVKASEPRIAPGTASESLSFRINVDRVGGLPQISDIRGLNRDEGSITRLEVGSITSLTVFAEDSSGTSRNPPSLVYLPCETARNGESPKFDGIKYLVQEERQALSETTYRFNLKFDLLNNPVPVTNDSEGVELCFQLAVKSSSGSGLVSNPMMRVIKATHIVQAPKILSANAQKVWPGQVIPVVFQVQAHETGLLEIKPNLESLPGEKSEIECKNLRTNGRENPNHRECKFTWTVPSEAVSSAQTHTLKIEVNHTVVRNGKNVVKKEEKNLRFEIQSDARPVTAKKKPATAAPAPAKAPAQGAQK